MCRDRAPAYIADGLPGPAATEFMDDVAQPLLDFIKAHSDWAALVMFVTAFGESFAFLSLLFPGTTVLVAAGTLRCAQSFDLSASGLSRRDG